MTARILILGAVFVTGLILGYLLGKTEQSEAKPVLLQFQVNPQLRTEPLPDWI